jgi:hypothetical protein
MNLAASSRRIALNSALAACVFLASGELARSAQSPAPEKGQTGSQAGSSGKTTQQMGSQGSTESPLRKCDSPEPAKTETTKTTKKKKAKKPAPTK